MAAPGAAEALAAQLTSELLRLRTGGMPVGYTWSGVTVPLLWLAPGTTRACLIRAWVGAGLHAQALQGLFGGFAAAGLSTASALAEWLVSEGHFVRPPALYSYLAAPVQEAIMARMDPLGFVQAAVCGSLRPAPVPAPAPEQP